MTDPQPEALEPVELLPCPWCDSRELIQAAGADGWWFVACMECMSDGPARDNLSRADSIAAWNRRAFHPTDGPRADDVERTRGGVSQEVYQAAWSALRFAASRSAISSEHELIILAALRPTPPPSMVGSSGEGWQPIETAPYGQAVEVRAGRMTFLASLQPGISENEAGESVDQWCAEREGEHPPCWSDGACWASNMDELASLQPTAWRTPPTNGAEA